MKIISHEHPEWIKRLGRTNGAETYSRDLIKYQLPYWERVLGENDLISTCPKLSSLCIDGNYNTIVQYLHAYPYDDCVGYAGLIQRGKFTFKNFLFISAYEEYTDILKKAGFDAVFIPMAIDVEAVASTPRMSQQESYVWFGNMTYHKKPMFLKLHRELKRRNIKLDYITDNKLNGASFGDTQLYKILTRYNYGFAVGRCAQEMLALGIKVIIAGREFGGMITTQDEQTRQLATNMNGRIYTYSNNLGTCLDNIKMATGKPNNIKDHNHAEIASKEYGYIEYTSRTCAV